MRSGGIGQAFDCGWVWRRKSRELDALVVALTYGYDIGIASGWCSHRYNFPIEEKIENAAPN